MMTQRSLVLAVVCLVAAGRRLPSMLPAPGEGGVTGDAAAVVGAAAARGPAPDAPPPDAAVPIA